MKKYEHLVMNGCSFTAGLSTWLKGTNPQDDKLSKSDKLKLSASRLLSKKLGCVEHNISQPGGSNERIIRTTYDFVKNNKELKDKTIIICGLSQISRMEVFMDNKIFQIRMGLKEVGHIDKHWLSRFGSNKELENWIRTYIKYFYHEKWEMEKLSRDLIFLQTFVEKEGFDIIFFSSILELDERESDVWSNYNLKLDTMDELNFFQFPNQSKSWRDFNGHGHHPNDEDNKILSDLLFEHIRGL